MGSSPEICKENPDYHFPAGENKEVQELCLDALKEFLNEITAEKKTEMLYNISEYSEFDDVKRKVVSFKEPKALDILREDLNPSVRKAVIENGREEDLDYFSENGTADDRATLLLTHKRDSDLDKAMDDSFYTNWDLSKCLK